MINKIKLMFPGTTTEVKNTVESLALKAANVIDVFTKTQTNLSKINLEIDGEIETRNVAISSLALENSSLETIKLKNAKVIEKLNQILE